MDYCNIYLTLESFFEDAVCKQGTDEFVYYELDGKGTGHKLWFSFTKEGDVARTILFEKGIMKKTFEQPGMCALTVVGGSQKKDGLILGLTFDDTQENNVLTIKLKPKIVCHWGEI